MPPHEKNCPPIRIGVWVKVRVSFRVGRQPGNCPRGKLPPVGVRVLVRISFEVEGNFPRDNCPRTF